MVELNIYSSPSGRESVFKYRASTKGFTFEADGMRGGDIHRQGKSVFYHDGEKVAEISKTDGKYFFKLWRNADFLEVQIGEDIANNITSVMGQIDKNQRPEDIEKYEV